MPGGVQVASLFGVLSLDDSGFRSGLSNAKTGLQGLGDNLKSAGTAITTLAAPLAGAFTLATNQATAFDESVTNIGAVLGLTRGEITSLSADLLSIGGDTVQGPQAVADAFYDIVGGVADASTHMAILEASIDTATAGNANLQGTTNALISTMNSYGFAAEQAGMVSDVLTQIVGMGVGTMDEFASALPQVTGLAASLNIPLTDVGGAMAFLTTKGNSASQASTQLGAIMSALMKPNADMIDALKELGFSSGDAAIKQLGLVGAVEAVGRTTTAGSQGMAALLGTQEAVRGSVALMGDDFAGFNQKFATTVDGVTGKAKEIQLGSAAAQFDLVKAQVSELAISIGNALLPSIITLLDNIRPIVSSITDWVTKNPELVSAIGAVALGAVVAGPLLYGLGTVISILGTVVGIVTSPIFLLGGALAALVYAASQLYPGGIPKLLSDAAGSAQLLGQIVQILLVDALNTAAIAAQQVVQIIGFGLNLVMIAANIIVNGVIQTIGDWIEKNDSLVRAIENLILTIGLVRLGLTAYNIIAGIAASVSAALATGAGLVSAAIAAITSPVVVLTASIWALITAYRELIALQEKISKSADWAAQTAGPAAAAQGLSQQQIRDMAFRASQSEFGGGFGGDLMARLLWGSGFLNMQGQVDKIYGARASGGSVLAGNPYIVGENGPEIFTPVSAGNITNSRDSAAMMGGATINGGLHIHANTREGGYAAMDGALARLSARGGR